MTRHKEDWLKDIFRGYNDAASRYVRLSSRELPIVAVAILDAALAHLLKLRLLDDLREVEAFLGTDGDGRAPAASVGARIQLAYLLGLISKEDVKVFRILKNIRNLFAHKVELNYLSPSVVKELHNLNKAWFTAMRKPTYPIARVPTDAEIGKTESAGKGLMIAVILTYEIYLHANLGTIERLAVASHVKRLVG